MAAAQEALAATSQASSAHLRTVCEFSSPSTPPLRAKVDRQSFDELKPGVDSAFAIIDWFGELQKAFVALLLELANSADPPSASALTALVEALDCCIVLENQFAGWSQCVNRFSWFKRTFTQIRREVAAEVDCDKLSRDLSRFQTFIGDIHFPVGMHLTGPLRAAVKKGCAGHERPVVAALLQTAAAAESAGASAPAHFVRTLPYLLCLADGDAGDAYDVFRSVKLQSVQRVFKKHPTAECAPPAELARELGLPAGYPVHLGTVLARCPHYQASMRTKWGMPKGADEESCSSCALL